MSRFFAVATLAFCAIQPVATQDGSVLHIKVSIAGADEKPMPVARHALLISDNPTTAAPRRVVTTPEGTAAVTLRPGSYTIESDRPSVVGGRSYQWTQIVHVVAGRDATLELTAANAEVGAATAEMEAAAAPTGAEAAPPAVLPVLTRWQKSTVGIWTEHRHAAGFLVSDNGLVATSQSAIGDATSVEVQLSTVDKIEGRVIATDAAHDIAVVQIDPTAAKNLPAVPLVCASDDGITRPQELVTIEVPMFGAKSATTGDVLKVDPQVIDADFALSASSAGGPVFAGDGPAVGLTSMPRGDDGNGRGQVRVMPAAAICGAVAAATAKLAGGIPRGAKLPVEPPMRPPTGDLKPRGASLSAYSATSSDFDILFITPAPLAGAESLRGRTDGANGSLSGLRAATEFGEWSSYVAQSPAVVFIRVTPKLVEGFWMKFARGAASTQGAQIPPITHLGPGFSRMRVLCGGKDVTPIHPFRIRTRLSDIEAVDEGFYVVDPASIGPQCGTVSIVLSSIKNPDKTETKVVDPGVIARVAQDFSVK